MKEELILEYLLSSEQYCRQVLPHLNSSYFQDQATKVIYEIIDNHYKEYNTVATKDVIDVELARVSNLNEQQFKRCNDLLTDLKAGLEFDYRWATDKTEKFCQDRAVYNAIMQSIKIFDGKERSDLTRTGIPKLLQDALAVQFNTSIGHNFIDDYENRYDLYQLKEQKIPFDIDMFNKITDGGLSRKTLNTLLGSTGTGKTLFMCHMAAAAFTQGYNVLYITMEMAEERIAERIDSNLLNIPLKEMRHLDKQTFTNKIAKVKAKSIGKLIIKEYPTSSAGALHFKNLLEELRIKKNFQPDIVFIDYLNICCSTRLKQHAAMNSYIYVKAIAEEIRGLAVEYDCAIVTATQTNRAGFSDSDVDLDNTSDSWGLPATTDFMCALITTEELAGMNQMMVKQLKNRYSDMNVNKRFVVGVDKAYMRLYDCEQFAQDDIVKDIPTMDNTPFGREDDNRRKGKRRNKHGNAVTMNNFLENI